MNPPKKRGRPTIYTPQIADEICERLAAGESLRSICSDPRMPSDSLVHEWAVDESEARPRFVERYIRARQRGYEKMAEELIAISDAEYVLRDGSAVDSAAVQQARLMSDNRKWLLARMLPSKYGDRVTQELVGDNARPIVTRIELVPISPRLREIEAPEDSD